MEKIIMPGQNLESVKKRRSTKKEKMERITQLREDIKELEERKHRPYEMKNFRYKDETLGDVGVDVEKLVIEKEEEIRRLENAISKKRVAKKEESKTQSSNQNPATQTASVVQKPILNQDPGLVINNDGKSGNVVETATASSAKNADKDQQQGDAMEAYLKREHRVDLADEAQGDRMEAFINNNEQSFKGNNQSSQTKKATANVPNAIETAPVMSQEEADEAAEYEMADKINRENKKEKFAPVMSQEEADEAAEYEMADKINRERNSEDMRPNELEMTRIQMEALVENARRDKNSAREAYVASDYRTSGILTRLRRFFGSRNLQTRTEGVSDTQELYEIYRTKSEEYKNLRIQELTERYKSMTPEELVANRGEMNREIGVLNTEFNLREFTELYRARNEAMLREREGKYGNRALEIGNRALNWYRELGFKNQMLISAALFGGGVLAAATGSVFLAGGVASVTVLRRIIGGISSGVGAVGAQESARRGLEKRRSASDTRRTVEDLKNVEDVDVIFERLSGKLQSNIDTFRNSLNTEKRKSISRRIIGAGLGVFVGSGLIGQFTQTGIAWAGDTEFGKNISSATGDLKRNVSSAADSFGRRFAVGIGIGADRVESVGKISNLGMEKTYGHVEPVGKVSNVGMEHVPGKHIDPVGKVSNLGMEHMPDHPKPVGKISNLGMEKTYGHVEPVGKVSNAGMEKTFGTAKPVGEISNLGMEHVPRTTLEIHKGSSFEGTLIEHLKASGVDTKEAGKIAHRMALKYAEDQARDIALHNGDNWQNMGKAAKKALIDSQMKRISLVHPGAHIEINPYDNSVESFHDSQPTVSKGQVHEHKPKVASKVEHVSKQPEIKPILETKEIHFSQINSQLDGIKGIEVENNSLMANQAELQQQLARLNSQIGYDKQSLDLGKDYPGQIRSGPSLRESMKGRMASRDVLLGQIENNKARIEALQQLYKEKFRNAFSAIINSQGGDITGENASKYVANNKTGSFGKFYEECSDALGDSNVRPKRGETMGDWTRRIITQMSKEQAR